MKKNLIALMNILLLIGLYMLFFYIFGVSWTEDITVLLLAVIVGIITHLVLEKTGNRGIWSLVILLLFVVIIRFFLEAL